MKTNLSHKVKSAFVNLGMSVARKLFDICYSYVQTFDVESKEEKEEDFDIEGSPI